MEISGYAATYWRESAWVRMLRQRQGERGEEKRALLRFPEWVEDLMIFNNVLRMC